MSGLIQNHKPVRLTATCEQCYQEIPGFQVVHSNKMAQAFIKAQLAKHECQVQRSDSK